jgi:hypothetical protein
MKTTTMYQVINRTTGEIKNNNGAGFSMQMALDLYDSLGGCAKGLAVIKM